jgi:hypothetical protein
MVPLDGAVASPAVSRIFRESRSLSLLVHGNNHVRAELGQVLSAGERLSLALQALDRIAAFESKHRLRVARVMVPPHNACSEAMMEALLFAGFEGLCCRDLTGERPAAVRGWHPADFEASVGLPVVQRTLFSAPLDELVLRAFLGHPLVLAGHHVDFKAGLEPLAAAAQRINRLGDVQWLPMDAILRSNVSTQRSSSTLHVRPWSRLFDVDAGGASSLVVDATDLPARDRDRVVIRRAADGAEVGSGSVGETIDIPGEDLMVALVHEAAGPPITPMPRRAWPFVRRRLAETRDRLLPVLPS